MKKKISFLGPVQRSVWKAEPLLAFWFLDCRLNCVKSKSPYERAVYTLGCGTVRVFYSARSDTPTCRFIQNIAGTLRRRPTAKPYYFDVLDFRTIRLPGGRGWITTGLKPSKMPRNFNSFLYISPIFSFIQICLHSMIFVSVIEFIIRFYKELNKLRRKIRGKKLIFLNKEKS